MWFLIEKQDNYLHDPFIKTFQKPNRILEICYVILLVRLTFKIVKHVSFTWENPIKEYERLYWTVSQCNLRQIVTTHSSYYHTHLNETNKIIGLRIIHTQLAPTPLDPFISHNTIQSNARTTLNMNSLVKWALSRPPSALRCLRWSTATGKPFERVTLWFIQWRAAEGYSLKTAM